MARSASATRQTVVDTKAALSFSGGSGTVVTITDASDLRLATGFTVVAKAYLNQRSGDAFKGIVSKGGTASGGERNYLLALNNGNTLLNCGYETVGGANQFATGTRQIPLKTWFHAGVTWDGSNVQCYQNGTADGSPFAATGTPCMTSADLEIGRNQNTTQEWDGVISDVILFSRALTAQEMSDLCNRNIVPTNGFVDRWKLDEGAGSTAFSQTGTHNGVITAATYTNNTPGLARKTVNGNLVKNGEFEYAPPFTAVTTTATRYIDGSAGGSTTNDLFGWAILNASTAGSFAASFDTTLPDSGTYSMKLSTTAIGSRLDVAPITGVVASVLPQTIAVLPNTTYTATFRMRTVANSGSATSGASLLMQERDAAAGSTVSNRSSSVVTTTGWTSYSFSFTTASTTRYIVPRLSLNGSDGTGTLIMDAWFDSVTLKQAYPEFRNPADGNLVKNPGFEYAPTLTAAQTTRQRYFDGSASGSLTNQTYRWGINGTNSTSSNISAQFDSTVSSDGTYSMKVSTTGTNAACAVSNILTSSQADVEAGAIRVLPNTTYSYRLRMKTNYVSGDSNDGAYAQFTERSITGASITSSITTKVKTTTDFTEYTGSFTTSSTTVWVTPIFFVVGNTGTATLIMDAWFDVIDFRKTTASRSAA